jgi:aspartyl protease family protein
MATDFMLRHCMGAALALTAPAALATDVQFVGRFGDKAAILAIDGAAPRTVKVGERRDGVGVLRVGPDSATVEVDGGRRVIRLQAGSRAAPASDARQMVVLSADARGHFYSEGRVNGGSVRFVVDTGATSIVLSARDADRLGIDYHKGVVGRLLTANGPARGWRVKLDRVRVGAIELQQVDAVVTDFGADVALLGMSFLNRVDLRRDGETMTLTRRY